MADELKTTFTIDLTTAQAALLKTENREKSVTARINAAQQKIEIAEIRIRSLDQFITRTQRRIVAVGRQFVRAGVGIIAADIISEISGESDIGKAVGGSIGSGLQAGIFSKSPGIGLSVAIIDGVRNSLELIRAANRRIAELQAQIIENKIETRKIREENDRQQAREAAKEEAQREKQRMEVNELIYQIQRNRAAKAGF